MTLDEEQRELESRGILDGERRFLTRVTNAYQRGSASTAPSSRQLMVASLEWLEAEINLRIDAEAEKHGGQAPAWLDWVAKIGVSTAAYLTLKAALNSMSGHSALSFRHASRTLTSMIMDEIRAQSFLAQDPAAYANAINHQKSFQRGARTARLLKRMRYHGLDIPISPTPREAMAVGAALLGMLVQSTGLFTLETVSVGSAAGRHKRSIRITPNEATIEWLRARNDHLRLMAPLHPPLLIAPKDWATGQAGGYHYALAGTLPLVRGQTTQAEQSPIVYEALNALQRTPWRINKKILAVAREAIDGRLPAIMPPPQDEPIPRRPDGDDEALKQWRRTAANVHQNNEKRRVKRADAERAYGIALGVSERERFYFPYSLDFRGRVYPAVEYLNPHGPDFVRGLLEFADGVEISSVGADWLLVHGANALGEWGGRKLSKLTFQERREVLTGLAQTILAIGDDPYENREWMKAEEPWQFLAFCFEWAEYLRDGVLYSHIPVAIDGTCNGLQHFSAMLRDPIGARSVNLQDARRPNDIYEQVAEAVTEALWRDMENPLAKLWLTSGLVTRKLVKRPVMTLVYGATKYGFVDQLLDTLRHKEGMWPKAMGTFRPANVRIRVAVQYLADTLWQVLPTVVGGALRAMAWLQQAAEIVAEQTGGPIEWTTPLTSFKARQAYWQHRVSQIKTLVNGQTLRPTVYVPTDEPNTRKIVNAIAPNVVHSADACAMMCTTSRVSLRGIQAFSMIHDSYAVHAEHIPVLARELRQVFMDMYGSTNFLQDLADQWAALGVELPPVPSQGDFDVAEVLSARYFFS